ncbi:transposase [Streptomyces actinomycinicus]|uniref:Transposase n=1 Tax=Streptomyces actinomycinicus TaxID=1695166 RepID=A0A937JT09_9ACTN|nr:transposase [Streptomyces actinomycinicus]
MLPPAGHARGRWRDHRKVLEGVVFKFRTGVPWRHLPERFGPWQTVHGRFARWAGDGTFDRILAAAQGRARWTGWSRWTPRSSGPTSPPLPKGPRLARAGALPRRADQQDSPGLRRTRPPLAFTVTACTRNDCAQAEAVIHKIRVLRPGSGRPRTPRGGAGMGDGWQGIRGEGMG